MRAAVLGVALCAACTRGSGPATPTPTPTATPTSAPVRTPADGAVVGTAHPILVEAVARDGSWVVICQARADTDGDGEIAVHVGMHGDTYGDSLRPYLVRGAGEGEPIESLVGFTRDGRWLVALRAGKLSLLDARSGAWTDLAGADVRDDGVPLGPPRAASIARAGDRMTYFRDDETIVVRELSSGTESLVKVPGARVWRVEVEPLGHWALVYAVRSDTDNDGALTWPSVRTSLSDRDCRGPIMSYSTGGWAGDKPDELWLELATATIATARAPGLPAESDAEEAPDLGSRDGHQVLARDRTGRLLLGPSDEEHGIWTGPLRWVAPD